MTKKIFTTGEVARLLGININTVIKWFDEGKIRGFRLPTSHDRRIPVANLVSFMETHGIPLDLLNMETPMRRKDRRVPVRSTAKLSIVNGTERGTYDAFVTNLSKGGIGLQMKGPGDLAIPTSHFNIRIELTDGPLSGMNWSGRIAHLKPAEDEIAIGVAFDSGDVAPDQSRRLQQYLDTSLVS
ncbi:MAG: PilZ domain-containing protein [Deltaproteobacteria bacterium]|nr:PilZ domain-containing protein [Deltaproteobacteria bacterium]